MFRQSLPSFALFLLFSFCPASLWGQEPGQPSLALLKLSLEECIQLAKENNAKLVASAYTLEGAQWRYKEAKASFKPILEVTNRMAPVPTDAQNAAQSFFEGDITFFSSTKVGIGVPILAFGKLATAKNLAYQGIQAAEEQKVKDKNELTFEVKKIYYGILLGAELTTILKDAIQKIDRQLAKEEQESEHSPYEIAKLKIFKLELAKRLAETGARAKLGLEALRVQMGLAPAQPFQIKDHFLDPTSQSLKPMQHYLQLAKTTRPELQLVDIGVRAKELEWRLEKRKLFPNLGLGGFLEVGRTPETIRNLGATDDFNDPFNYTRAGVGLEIQGQFDLHGARTRIKRLESEYLKVKTESSLAKEGIGLEIQEAYQEVLRLKEDLDRAEDRKKLSRQMVFLSKSNLEVGVGEEQEYTDALQLLLLARSEYFKAVFDYNVALAKLAWKTGGEL